MTSGSDSRHALEALARAVQEHGGGYGVMAHARVLDLCAEAVAFAREDHGDDGASIAVRARSAAELLLELICPYIDAPSRRALGVACERAATGLV